MPVPGFLSGVHAAHNRFGKLKWEQLFEPAIRCASEGFPLGPLVASAASTKAIRFEDGRALWMKEGRNLRAGETLIQKELAKTLQRVAAAGPEYFYTGEFATNYVRRAAADGGLITLKDMAAWQDLSIAQKDILEGNYRGYQIAAAGLSTYALHLNEALDLKSKGPARTNPESLFRQFRIMEEVFLSSKDYTKETHEQYVSPDYARRRADEVLNGPPRKLTFDAIFNTCFLVVRDRHGNIAWGTHSINTPTAFGAGILVDGVYAAHAMNREHVRGSGGSARGVSTSLALFKDGKPRLIAGSPGFGFVHGPWQYTAGVIEWELSPTDAMNQPRFSLPRQDGNFYFESHYDDKVLEMLKQRKIPFFNGRPSTFTGLVGALTIDDEQKLHVVQDGRVDGYALAK
jgi:gamma-glutamyltranspeptidase/glutathione hydrolase